MADRPILFSAPMVRALLAGTKTQTRRVLKPQPYPLDGRPGFWNASGAIGGRICVSDRDLLDLHRKAAPGDRLWVREAHARVPSSAYRCSEGVQQAIDPADEDNAIVYRADWERSAPPWRPSIHMPRWASRLTLIVESVKVERLQDISEADAIAEGATRVPYGTPPGVPERDAFHHGQKLEGWNDAFETACASYRHLWNSINGPGSWETNPWVTATTFRVLRGNIDNFSKEIAA